VKSLHQQLRAADADAGAAVAAVAAAIAGDAADAREARQAAPLGVTDAVWTLQLKLVEKIKREVRYCFSGSKLLNRGMRQHCMAKQGEQHFEAATTTAASCNCTIVCPPPWTSRAWTVDPPDPYASRRLLNSDAASVLPVVVVIPELPVKNFRRYMPLTLSSMPLLTHLHFNCLLTGG